MSEDAKFVMSRKLVAFHKGLALQSVASLISRGRLTEAHVLCKDGIVRKGVPLESVADYWGWPPAIVDQMLERHGLNPDSPGNHYLTAQDEQ